jgi:hypothetical protein
MAAGLTEDAHREYPKLGYSTRARSREDSVVKACIYGVLLPPAEQSFTISKRYVGFAPKRSREAFGKYQMNHAPWLRPTLVQQLSLAVQ